jgi:hypothetical protein
VLIPTGFPQCGQTFASVLISLPHSLQGRNAIGLSRPENYHRNS